MNVQRLRHFVEKRLRARRLGVRLVTSRRFRLPTFIRLAGVRHRLKLPNQIGTRVAFSELLLADCYGLEKVGEPINTVLDIGANVGLFCLAARHAFPQAVIHAYEPNPHLERYLSTQAKMSNCHYFMEAVTLTGGRVTLDFQEDSVLTRSESSEDGSISAVSLQKAIDRLGGQVDFAKIDCEGAEWDLWQDSQPWQKIRTISMEYHLWPDHTHDEVPQILQNLGFTVQEQIRASDFGLIRASRQRD